MFRRTAFVSVPALAFVLLAALAARAADDPLKIIPGNALGWGVINHLADGDGKIQKLAGVVGARKSACWTWSRTNSASRTDWMPKERWA